MLSTSMSKKKQWLSTKMQSRIILRDHVNVTLKDLCFIFFLEGGNRGGGGVGGSFGAFILMW